MSISAKVTALAALAVLGGSVAANAAIFSEVSSGNNTVSVKVSYADLDLQNQAGAQIMLRRIHHAASIACGNGPDDRLFWTVRAYRMCIDKAAESAIVRLHSPIVSALNGRAGGELLASRGQ